MPFDFVSFVLFRTRWRRALAVLIALLVLPAGTALAFPDRPIRLIVPFAAGGSTNLIAREVAIALQRELGQPVTVENRGGAGGMIGSDAVARATPDGYTIGMATASTLTVNPLFHRDAVATSANLLPIANLVCVSSVFSVHPSMQVNDFAGFVAALKRKPMGYSAAVPGAGSLSHLLVEAVGNTLGIKILTVPYSGIGSALGDALNGTVDILPDQIPTALPYLKAGKLLPVVVASPQRLRDLPNVPTFKELGYPDLNDLGISWFGLVVPAATPRAIVQRLQTAALNAVRSPDMQARLQSMGATVVGADGASFQAMVAAQLKRNRAIVRRADIRID